MATVKFTVQGFRLAGPPPVAPYLYDSFERADGPIGSATEGQVTQAWQALDAVGFVVSGGAARAGYGPAGSAVTNYRTVLDAAAADFYMAATLGNFGTITQTGAPDPGFLARLTDTSNYLRLEFNASAGFRLRNVGGGGTNTVLHSSGLGWTTGAVLSLKAVGDQVTYGVGDQKFTVTAPNNRAGTKVGLIAKASDTAYAGTFGDFKVLTGSDIPA